MPCLLARWWNDSADGDVKRCIIIGVADSGRRTLAQEPFHAFKKAFLSTEMQQRAVEQLVDSIKTLALQEYLSLLERLCFHDCLQNRRKMTA